MCMCTVVAADRGVPPWAPYVWTTLLASTQGYIHRAEYIGKRLKTERTSARAARSTRRFQRTRSASFGIIYYDTDDIAYKQGVDFFVKHLKEKYGIVIPRLVAEYHGYPGRRGEPGRGAAAHPEVRRRPA